MSIEMKVVLYPEVTKEDVQDIEKAIAADSIGMDLEVIHNSIRDGVTLVWRYTSPEGRGVILTKVNRGTRESELFVWYLAGAKMAPNGEYISAVLEEYCRLNNLKRITGVVRKGMRRVLKPFGYAPDRYLISKEITNGRQ